MSKRYPIVAVTGSSGTRRSMVREAFVKVSSRAGVVPVYVDGAAFHRYDRHQMKEAQDTAVKTGGKIMTHFGPEANLWGDLEALFAQFGESGTGRHRRYLHTEEEAEEFADHGLRPGQFTEWTDLPCGGDLLVYEGLHGALANDHANVAQHVDLKVGVAPIINLEWIQKIHKDVGTRGYTQNEVMETILSRMHDYVHYILPQFHHSDINFQRVAVVDTSNPFVARDVPTDTETMVVIRFRDLTDPKVPVDFLELLRDIPNARMTRRNTLLIPGGQMGLAMELILPPVLQRLIDMRG